jgi:hypothetical protein
VIYTFRPLGIWTDKETPVWQRRSRWAFKASWQSTLNLLARELDHLSAKSIVIEADFAERDIRLDGMPRANARNPSHPGIRIAFDSKHGPLIYATDSCEDWQHNVRSIALGLEALRAVDRYGITHRAEQYTGWKAITDGSPTHHATPVMSAREAAEFMGPHGDVIPETLLLRGPTLRHSIDVIYKRAARKLHPDAGGDDGDFQRLQEAKRVLDEYAGVQP